MSENKFEKKLRGTFKDHEMPVSPGVWTGIAEGMATSATTAAIASSKLFKTIGAAVVMIGIGIGSTVLYFNQKSEANDVVEKQIENQVSISDDADTPVVSEIEKSIGEFLHSKNKTNPLTIANSNQIWDFRKLLRFIRNYILLNICNF
jgi:hypothetical protein